MSKNTSISLGDYFDQFIHNQIETGRYKNVSEVVRAALRLLEREEKEVTALKMFIQEGIDSGINENFDAIINLEKLKSKKR
jgi:antitoxin ParD1/3/4